jgi:hypothetical protein
MIEQPVFSLGFSHPLTELTEEWLKPCSEEMGRGVANCHPPPSCSVKIEEVCGTRVPTLQAKAGGFFWFLPTEVSQSHKIIQAFYFL